MPSFMDLALEQARAEEATDSSVATGPALEPILERDPLDVIVDAAEIADDDVVADLAEVGVVGCNLVPCGGQQLAGLCDGPPPAAR